MNSGSRQTGLPGEGLFRVTLSVSGMLAPGRLLAGLLFGTIVLVTLPGCSGEAERQVAKRRSNLTQVALAYQRYHNEQGKSPANSAELIEFMSASSTEPAVTDAIESLTEGDVVVFWGGQLAGDSVADSTLAFEASVGW